MEKVKFQLTQVWLVFSNFASNSTKCLSLGLEHLWDISSESKRRDYCPAPVLSFVLPSPQDLLPAVEAHVLPSWINPQHTELETQEVAQHLGG